MCKLTISMKWALAFLSKKKSDSCMTSSYGEHYEPTTIKVTANTCATETFWDCSTLLDGPTDAVVQLQTAPMHPATSFTPWRMRSVISTKSTMEQRTKASLLCINTVCRRPYRHQWWVMSVIMVIPLGRSLAHPKEERCERIAAVILIRPIHIQDDSYMTDSHVAS